LAHAALAQHLPVRRRQLAEPLPQLHTPLGRHHAVTAIALGSGQLSLSR
jgi:hypothetical protein